MTVKELIEKLKEYPSDMPVMVQGYEDGFDIVSSVGQKEMVDGGEDHRWYYGRYHEPP